VVPKDSYGAALNYFTGSKDHNVALREIAVKKGYKLNEYGLFKGKKRIAGRTEEEIYNALGMSYIEPEIRENSGEIKAAQMNQLPKLIGYNELLGDLQVQTNWTDGANSIEEMAKAAMSIGLEYIAITDHTKRLAMTGGLDEKRIQEQWREIDSANLKIRKQNPKFKILKGTECDILKDGSLDLPDKILAKLDVVGASVHSYFNLSRQDQTNRIKKAMANPFVDIIFHPTGRIINRRQPYEVDIDELIKFAKKTGTILEIDAYPDRLDLKDEHIRKCVEAGVKLAIDSDAHSIAHFSYLEYGLAQARRGWATKNDVINAWPLEKMLSFLKK
jgi:DNA polymerase (family 10)